jgi:hypothetical protein
MGSGERYFNNKSFKLRTMKDYDVLLEFILKKK